MSDIERKEFETWAAFDLMAHDFERGEHGEYLDDFLQQSWLGWQAARAQGVPVARIDRTKWNTHFTPLVENAHELPEGVYYCYTHPPTSPANQGGVPAGWSLKKVAGEKNTISITRESDGAWCGGGIEGDSGAQGLRYEFLNAMLTTSPGQEWVKCSERLPDKGVIVLVCVDYDHHKIKESILTAHWTGSTFKIGPNSVNFNCDAPVVTHWMPMPQPPREQEGE